MFFIPGFLISLVTFPGVIIHEMAHQFFCRICRLAVFEVCYFRVGNPSGYVIHEAPHKASHNILVGIGPFLVNTILGAVIALPGAIAVFKFSNASFLDYFLAWLGISIAMHAFPSTGDAKNIWDSIKSDQTPALTKIIGTPIVLLIYIGAFGSVVWLDLVYGMFIAMAIPNILVSILA